MEEEDKKIWLVEAVCPVDTYRCLMPVEYLPVEHTGIVHTYSKNRMVCRHALSGECDQVDTCVFFKDAPDTLDKNVPWYKE